MNLTYVGTHLSDNKAANGTACVKGFDQAGFIMGTSASLFNVRNSRFFFSRRSSFTSKYSTLHTTQFKAFLALTPAA
jgi:hypothetical protein